MQYRCFHFKSSSSSATIFDEAHYSSHHRWHRVNMWPLNCDVNSLASLLRPIVTGLCMPWWYQATTLVVKPPQQHCWPSVWWNNFYHYWPWVPSTGSMASWVMLPPHLEHHLLHGESTLSTWTSMVQPLNQQHGLLGDAYTSSWASPSVWWIHIINMALYGAAT